jgi:two-component system CheB/CheR fusion protein
MTTPPGEPATPAEEGPPANTPHGPPFPVIGVGASAGGLEAFTEMLEHVPDRPEMSFLYVQHLDPNQKSHLAEIFGKVTRLPVREATEGMVVEKDAVYLIPPNMSMALTDGKLLLTPRPPARAPHMPIDHLFRSIAAVLGSRAIGVLLSGMGTDGTLGFQAIKAEGGITFAQDDQSARFDAMPRSAAADGCVDYVLPPGDIARQLARLVRHPYAAEPEKAAPAARRDEGAIDEIISVLRSGTAVDFTNYKRSTIRRRILRRMALRGIVEVGEYLRFLREDPAEPQSLFQDFLIRVTQFFRDPEVFDALRDKVFPQLVQGRNADAPVRLWVAGCASGEEVYSLAIALLEYLGGRAEHVPLKILATDVNEVALEKARAGIYLDNIELDVSPERLRRFFVRVNHNYQINKAVRDLCVFSRHNLTSDPPFSHLDLISCRNVLIYMDVALQKRLVPIFHYALNPTGTLLLGTSESIGGFAELFTPLDARHRIFTKKAAPSGVAVDFSPFASLPPDVPRAGRAGPALWSALEVQ